MRRTKPFLISGFMLAALSQYLGAQTLFSLTSFLGNTVRKYDAQSGSVLSSSLVAGLNSSGGIALDGNGFIYVTDYSAGTVGKYQASNGAVINSQFVAPLGALANGMVIDNNNHLFIATGLGVFVANLTSGAVSGTVIHPPNNGSFFLATDNASNLYVATPGAISRYDSAGTLVASSYIAYSGPDFIRDFVVDSNGILFLASGAGGASASTTISTYDAITGQSLNAAFITGLVSIVSMSLDGSGRLYVATATSVGVYDAINGVVINTQLINAGAQEIAVSPIPEPSAFTAIVAVGTAGIAIVRRRMRRSRGTGAAFGADI